jgi:hypothetical protein
MFLFSVSVTAVLLLAFTLQLACRCLKIKALINCVACCMIYVYFKTILFISIHSHGFTSGIVGLQCYFR